MSALKYFALLSLHTPLLIFSQLYFLAFLLSVKPLHWIPLPLTPSQTFNLPHSVFGEDTDTNFWKKSLLESMSLLLQLYWHFSYKDTHSFVAFALWSVVGFVGFPLWVGGFCSSHPVTISPLLSSVSFIRTTINMMMIIITKGRFTFGRCPKKGRVPFADSVQTEYCSTFHCSCVRSSQAWHLTFLTYIKA